MALMEQYRSAFTKDKFMTGDVACTAGTFTKLGQYKVEAGELVSLGYGANESMEGSPGRLYIDLKDNAASPGANVEGIIRFSVWSPQDRPLRILYELHTSQVRTDKADRTKQIPFPSSGFPFVSEDRKIVIEFKPDTTVTVGKANSTIFMDVTLGVA